MTAERRTEWPVTWEANRLDQLRTALRSTPEQRLQWLEDAIRLAFEARAGRARGGAPEDPAPSRGR